MESMTSCRGHGHGHGQRRPSFLSAKKIILIFMSTLNGVCMAYVYTNFPLKITHVHKMSSHCACNGIGQDGTDGVKNTRE